MRWKVLITDHVWPSTGPEAEVLEAGGAQVMVSPDSDEDTLVTLAKDVDGINIRNERYNRLLAKSYDKYSKEIKANLAVSLNGVNDSVRSALMPVNKAYNLEQLVDACREYPLESHKRITFEYILIRNLTDSPEDAKGLIRLLHGVKFKVNLIPFNETPGSPYQRPEWPSIDAFQQYLLDRGVLATLRISKGQDIAGACGQLVVQEAVPA